jgi:hypothetical protein
MLGIGKLPRREDGIFGDTLIITIEEELGCGLGVNQMVIVEIDFALTLGFIPLFYQITKQTVIVKTNLI